MAVGDDTKHSMASDVLLPISSAFGTEMSPGNYLPLEKHPELQSQDLNDVDKDLISEEETERDRWPRKLEYILSMIGFCVGLANVWRFPYICIRNGGGVFLIPFIICMALCAVPLFFLEVSLGQFLGKGPLQVWKAICPLFKGIGVATTILCLLVTWYYTMILAWSLIYLVHSFRSPLPWTQCNQPWNTPSCLAIQDAYQNNTSGNSSQMQPSLWNSTMGVVHPINNETSYIGRNNISVGNWSEESRGGMVAPMSSSEEFWLHNVLEISSGLENMNGIPWHTAIALLVTAISIFLGTAKGIHSSGKAVYVTATMPYILLTILIIKGATLPGAIDGVIFYLKPDFGKLLHLQTWREAAIQVFYSMGPAIGALINLASFNKFHNNCLRDSILLSIVCESTSFYGGFAIFTVLGHMAQTAKVPVANVTEAGPGLAFIVYPEAISFLPLPQLWAVLFFLTLFTLGLDSQFTILETLMTSIIELYPKVLAKYRILVTAVGVALIYLLSLPFAARGGIYLFQLADWYIAAFTLIVVAILESVTVAWVYGANRFQDDIELMIGRRPPVFFVIAWKFITPILLLMLFVTTLATYKPPTYGGYHYNIGGYLVGWFMAFISFIPIPVCVIVELFKARGTLMQRLKKAARPSPNWLPSDPICRQSYRHMQEDSQPTDFTTS